MYHQRQQYLLLLLEPVHPLKKVVSSLGNVLKNLMYYQGTKVSKALILEII